MNDLIYREQIRTAARSSGWLIFNRSGNLTLTYSGRSRVYRAPCCAVVPFQRTEQLDIQGSCSAFEAEREFWHEIDRESRRKGLHTGRECRVIQLDDFDCEFVARLFRQAEQEAAKPEYLRDEFIMELMTALIVLVHRRLWGSLDQKSVWTVSDAMSWIDGNISESFRLDFFAGRCAMSVSDFSRRFKSESGYTLFEYINREKIRRACTLLKRSQRSILDISTSLGYNNISFFNRYFRRIMGMTPSEFRTGRR
jgi:AraC-like DNA-binding protein